MSLSSNFIWGPFSIVRRQSAATFLNHHRIIRSVSTLRCGCCRKTARLSQILHPSSDEALYKNFATSTVSSSLSLNSQPTPSPASESWDLYAGVVVERKPIITQEKDAFQEKYFKVLQQIEFELSKKSDHEIRLEKDKKMLEKVKSGEVELGNVATARDDEDRWIAEAQAFVPASRKTEADSKNDVKSLDRALDSHLLLVVEQKLGKDYKWICPHSKLEPGETLRQASERMLRDLFPDMKTKILGHAPWGFYKYKYPQESRTDAFVGAKVFFYKAQVVSGEPVITKEKEQIVRNFAWLKRDELPEKLTTEYFKSLSQCLIDE